MGIVRGYTADEDRDLLEMYEQGKTFQQIGFRLGRSPDGVCKRYRRLTENGIDQDHLRHLHRLAVGFLK